MALPAQIRSRFDNDPAKLIDFLENEQNHDEAIKLGLVNPPGEMPQVVESTPEKAVE
jgi:phage internal scaffolding protein